MEPQSSNIEESFSMFSRSINNLKEERDDNKADISGTLKVEISTLLRELGEKFDEINPEQLQAIYETFSKVSDKIIKFADDIELWKDDKSMPDNLRQAVATVKNLTDVQSIPIEVQKDKAYHGDALKHALIALNDLKLPRDSLPSTQALATNYAADVLKKLFPKLKSKQEGVYLIRPSSSKVSNKDTQVVTVSFMQGKKPKQLFNIRCYFDKKLAKYKDAKPWKTSGVTPANSLNELVRNWVLKKNGIHTLHPAPVPPKEDVIADIMNRYTNFEDD